MLSRQLTALLGLSALAVAAPAPQASSAVSTAAQASSASASAAPQSSPATAPIPPVRSSQVTGATSHGPYNGPAPTTTGALMLSPQAATLPMQTVEPYTYPADGQLHGAEPIPYQPAGGLGTNNSAPIYHPLTDFDYESLALALYQEWIELDLFHNGLATFSVADFEAAGLTAADRFLIEFMADQEVGHSTLISNMLGAAAPPQCTYNYPFTTVREFVDFNQRLTRFGESGVYGFLGHLNSQAAASLLLQSITTEARQQMIFRQFNGQFPMPVWFETGIPQSWAWTLLAPYISSCPANTTRLAWQNFPALTILNNPSPYTINANISVGNSSTTGANNAQIAGIPTSQLCLNATDPDADCAPAISSNRSIPLSYPGRPIQVQWGAPNETVGPNGSYLTSSTATAPVYCMFVSQLNASYVPLMNISGNTGTCIQPNMSTFAGDPAANGTMFIAITDSNIYVTPYNLSYVNPHVWSGPAIYQAG